jgi:hypothetical protein
MCGQNAEFLNVTAGGTRFDSTFKG